jgi:peptidase M23-like protein
MIALRAGRPIPGSSSRKRVNHLGNRFSLLIVRGDGVRVMRVNFRRPLAMAGFAALAITVSVFGALVGDWMHLRALTRDAADLTAQLDEQRRTIAGFNGRVADLRHEIEGWRDLHARIQAAFGPEILSAGRDRGIGGPTAPPDGTSSRLSPDDELERVAGGVKAETENLRALDRIVLRASRALAMLPSRWPVRGAVNSEFGNRPSPWSRATEFHSGLDIHAATGTPVHAPATGVVNYAGAAGEYGTAVIVEHGQDIRTLYGHLSRAAVHSGQKIERGTVLGYTGNTGRSSGPHLHYEILVRGHAVNPRAYLWD